MSGTVKTVPEAGEHSSPLLRCNILFFMFSRPPLLLSFVPSGEEGDRVAVVRSSVMLQVVSFLSTPQSLRDSFSPEGMKGSGRVDTGIDRVAIHKLLAVTAYYI